MIKTLFKLLRPRKTLKIGYQGTPGSFSEKATKIFLSLGICDSHIDFIPNNIELVPLVTSSEVTRAIKDKKIDLGVIAYSNTISGIVRETKKTMEDKSNKNLVIYTVMQLPIHQCLYAKPGIKRKDINQIATHVCAFKQVEKNITKHIPNARFLKQTDTAIAAKLLSEGILDEKTAVVCSEEAGKKYNLKLLGKNIEDKSENFTEFIMIGKKNEAKNNNK